MVLLKRHQLKASSLLESVFAMAVVMICFGIGITVYVNVTQSGKETLRLRAEKALQQWSAETKSEKRFVDETRSAEGIDLRKTIEKYPGTENLHRLRLKALDSEGALLAEMNELIIDP